MHILRQTDILTLLHSLTKPQCLQLLETLSETLRAHSSLPTASKSAHQPPRSHLTTPSGTTLFMPASTTANTGIKTVTLPRSGGPAVGTLTISGPSGEPLGLLNAEDVTAFRTALVALLLFVRYEWKPSGNVVIFGAGKIVEWHLRLLLLLVPEKIESITLVNRSLSGLERLAGVISELRGRFEKVDFELVARDQEEEYEKILEEVIGESDAVFCCTPSTEPLFPHAFFGTERKRYISLIGSYKPNMQEITKETLLAGDFLVVDSREACLSEAGELIMGGIKGKDVVELGDLIAERERFHIGEKGIVFKCVGMGIMDVAIGKELLNLARQKKLGIEVKNF